LRKLVLLEAIVNYVSRTKKKGKVRGGVGTLYLDKLKYFQILFVHVDLLWRRQHELFQPRGQPIKGDI
jgi:hypothetical protein